MFNEATNHILERKGQNMVRLAYVKIHFTKVWSKFVTFEPQVFFLSKIYFIFTFQEFQIIIHTRRFWGHSGENMFFLHFLRKIATLSIWSRSRLGTHF